MKSAGKAVDRWSLVRRRLADSMRRAGMNKAQASRALNKSAGFIHDFQSGKQKTLDDEDINTLALALGVDARWLHGWDATPVSGVELSRGDAIAWFCDFTKDRKPEDLARVRDTIAAAFS